MEWMLGTMTHFLDAYCRHWEDGETLYGAGRLANADHLYGLCAECGIKAVMQGLGMLHLDAQGQPEKEYKKHVDVLWSTFCSLAEGRSQAPYATLLPGSNPFGDWKIEQRYAPSTHFTDTRVSAHRSGVDAVHELVRQARTDGKLL